MHVDQIRGSGFLVSRGLSLADRASNNTQSGAITWGTESGGAANPATGNQGKDLGDGKIEQQVEGQNGNASQQRYPTRSRKAPERYELDNETGECRVCDHVSRDTCVNRTFLELILF